MIFLEIMIVGIFLLLVYILVVINNGFSVLSRDQKAGFAKNDILVRKCDEIVNKYSKQVQAIAKDIQGR